MSKQYAESLLLQYNKDLYKKKPAQDAASTRFGTWSYANTYDALYDRYSQNRNFNINMWRDAIKLGEQDNYFALLEQNKDNTLSGQFYDDEYYDYEAMMMEMYLPLADNTKLEKYSRDVFNDVTGKWETQDLGEMTQRQYFEYLLAETRAVKAAEIQRQIEQDQKDARTFWETLGSDIGATLGELGEGLLSIVTSTIDVLGGLGYASYQAIADGDNWADAFVEYFGELGLTQYEKETVRAALDEYERTHTHFRDIDGNITGVGKWVAGIANSLGMMIPSILLAIPTGGTSLYWLPQLTFYTGIFGSNVYENATNTDLTGPAYMKIINAGLKTGAEALIEWGLGKAFGVSIQDTMRGLKMGSLKTFVKNFSKTSGLKWLAKSTVQEGLEEFSQDFTTSCIDAITGLWLEGYGKEGISFQTLVDSFCIGMASSFLISNFHLAKSNISSAVKNAIRPGSGDLVIEIDNELQTVRGYNKLYFAEIISEFSNSLKSLRRSRFGSKKNFEQAKELYGITSALSQFYSSFDAGRIERCEMLLDRVIKEDARRKAVFDKEVDRFVEENERVSQILSEETIAEIVSSDSDISSIDPFSKEFTEEVTEEYISSIERTFEQMTGGAKLRHILKKNAEKLKKNGVTKVTNVRSETPDDKEGSDEPKKQITLQKDPALQDLEAQLTAKAESKLDELIKNYKYVIVTDGHIAVENEDVLFVSEPWLENYTTSEIYEFLSQSQIIDMLIEDEAFKPLLESLKKFYKDFTKTDADAERVVMEFLFNPSVYQSFILSDNGKNLHTHKDIIYTFYNYLAGLGKMWSDDVKELSAERTAKLETCCERIKKAWRDPTIKAILIWGFEPQTIGADEILTEQDREFIQLYQQRHLTLLNAGKPHTSAQEHLADDILRKVGYELDREQKEAIKRARSENVTTNERLDAFLCLDYVDEHHREILDNFADEAAILNNAMIELSKKYQGNENSVEYLNSLKELLSKYEDVAEIDDVLELENIGADIVDTINHKSKGTPKKDNGYLFILPYDAVINLISEGKIDKAQSAADAMHDFEREFGRTVKEIIGNNSRGDVTQKFVELSEVYGVDISTQDGRAEVVQRWLENRAYGNLIVTFTQRGGLVFAEKISADEFLDEKILTLDRKQRDAIFIQTYGNGHRTVKDFINLRIIKDSNIAEKLGRIPVVFENLGTKRAGYYDGKQIVINSAIHGHFENLIHEFNHALQDEYNLDDGGSPDGVSGFRDFEKLSNYFKREFPNFVRLVKTSSKNLTDTQVLAKCIYYALQGEIFSRTTTRNEKNVRGFRRYVDRDRLLVYLISPDGKEKFLVGNYSYFEKNRRRNSESEPSITPAVAESALETSMLRVFRSRGFGSRRERAKTRNTVHSRFTGSSVEVFIEILNPNLSMIDRTFVKNLSVVIDDPARYLKPEILAMCNGDLSEGNVFYRLKEYVENNIPGISIDRRASDHAYIFVNDNAYDDLLEEDMLNKSDLSTKTLYADYGTGKRIPLSEFYKSSELYELGIHPNSYVIISNKVRTETRRNNDYPYGAIFINANENTTDAAIIDRLNHEFRHLLQLYSGFETGFTAEISVSNDMIADVKKHIPAIFADKDIREFAKSVAKKGESTDSCITRYAIYYSVGGELNAYGFDASMLGGKPAYVTKDGGNLRVFMPWYKSGSDEGVYDTAYIGVRSDDITIQKPSTEKGAEIPRVSRKPKYEAAFVDPEHPENVFYKYKNDRHYTKRDAEGTNLMYFWRKGVRQIDPVLRDFIIATTNHLDELPPELASAIKDGILTKQSLFKWFRKVDDIDQFTFDLIKTYFFPNSVISTFDELNKLGDPSFYWAAAQVLRKEGFSIQSLINENDVTKFLSFLYTLEGSAWKKKITNKQEDFYTVFIEQKNGKYKKEEVAPNEKLLRYMRVLTMQWFDGSLAGAFYVADSFRKAMTLFEAEEQGILSLNAKAKSKDGDGEELINRVKSHRTVTTDSVGNDILAVFESKEITDIDVMINELVMAYYGKLADEQGLDVNNLSDEQIKSFRPQLMVYMKTLQDTDENLIEQMYRELKNAELTETSVENDFFTEGTKKYSKVRTNIVARIKRTSTNILNLIRDGKIAFSNLPEEVQAMFELKEAKTVEGKKSQVYVLKSSVYSVGRGRKALSGTTDKVSRFKYEPKRDISDDTDAFKHDVDDILENDALLRQTLALARQVIKEQQLIGSGIKKSVSKVQKLQRHLEDTLKTATTRVKDAKMKSTEIRVTSKNRVSDTPNVFTIVSPSEMPDILHRIFDVSFEQFADTEVQWASRDVNGELYTKEKHGNFDSRIKHEKVNWDLFYETNRDLLQTLSRNDVLDIIAFFENGATTINGPTNKFFAFELFLLGYFIDAARHNYHNWNFSDGEIEIMEKLFAQKGSAMGSGLNAVAQMQKVINPTKVIKDRMFDDWDAVDDGDKGELIKLIDKFRKTKSAEEQKELGKEISDMIADFNARQIAADKDNGIRWSKRWWSGIWRKVKTFRYMAMLSGPATWVRNLLGNIILKSINKVSDVISDFVFSKVFKKSYRESQWDLHSTSTSEEVKNFIDTYINKNPMFDPMYELSGKYDVRRKKEIKGELGLFVSLITKAYEKEYSAKTNNVVTKLIQKCISDKRFIKGAAGRYFGKMLTIEVERGNINLADGLNGKALNLFAEAIIIANGEYMHKRSAFSDMLDGVRDKHPLLYEALMFWQPFLNSGFQWYVEKFIKLTPIGLINACIRLARFEKQVEKLDARRASGETVVDSRAAQFLIRRDIGKGIVGMLLSVLGAILALAGRMRIDEEDEKFYVYAGDVKFDISDIFASSSVFIGASIAQGWVEQEDGDTASLEDIVILLTDTLLDGFVATDILERHKYDDNPYEYLLTETSSMLSSFVPQAWQTVIACTNNEKIRYSSGMKGMWERWLNTFVPTQPIGNRVINPYTGETETKYALPILGILKKGILGPKIWWVDVSETERMCREYDVNKNELTGEITINGQKKKLDRLALNKKYGELNKESLAKIKSQKHKVEMPNGKYQTLSWDKMNDEQRANVISRTMTHNANIAKVYIWTQTMDKKYYASESVWKSLKELGITKNVYRGDKGFVE